MKYLFILGFLLSGMQHISLRAPGNPVLESNPRADSLAVAMNSARDVSWSRFYRERIQQWYFLSPGRLLESTARR
ncbi:hypothetical protein [Dyadobacter helix]|uniref:hypothetical protein n=1 Tax=Dyadobacter helix TaxID=2822344 RepID=UPI001BFC6978|nr:hypothetical protein [Dyadobacter sp. CECT 9275]